MAGVAVGEGNYDAVKGENVEASEGIGSEAGFGLLSICDDWRASLFEARKGVAKSGGEQFFRGDFPVECACIAASKAGGRGILPIGSVGMGIGHQVSAAH